MEEKILSILESIQSDVKNINTRLGCLETRFDNLETRFDNLETRFDLLESQVSENTQILKGLEHKVDVIKAEQSKIMFEVVDSKRVANLAKEMAFDAMFARNIQN